MVQNPLPQPQTIRRLQLARCYSAAFKHRGSGSRTIRLSQLGRSHTPSARSHADPHRKKFLQTKIRPARQMPTETTNPARRQRIPPQKIPSDENPSCDKCLRRRRSRSRQGIPPQEFLQTKILVRQMSTETTNPARGQGILEKKPARRQIPPADNLPV
jgi:hypothetical protein